MTPVTIVSDYMYAYMAYVNSQAAARPAASTDEINCSSLIMRTKAGSSSAVMQIISFLFPPAVIYMVLGEQTIPKSRRDVLLMRWKIKGHRIMPPSQEGDPSQHSLNSHSAQCVNNFLKRFLFFKNLFKCCRKQINLPLLQTPILSSNRAFWTLCSVISHDSN